MLKEYRGYKIEKIYNCIKILRPDETGWSEDLNETDEYIRHEIDADIEEREA